MAAVKGTVKTTSLKGEQVNNIPSTFKGKIILPMTGWVEAKKEFDFGLAVQTGASSSRLRATLEGKVETEKGVEDYKRDSATLWAGAISFLQAQLKQVTKDGEVVYATI